MVGMDPRTRRLGWRWWALAYLLVAVGFFIVYRVYRIYGREPGQETRRVAAVIVKLNHENAEGRGRPLTEGHVREILGAPDFTRRAFDGVVEDEWVIEWPNAAECNCVIVRFRDGAMLSAASDESKRHPRMFRWFFGW
jgi:hypothetical protein